METAIVLNGDNAARRPLCDGRPVLLDLFCKAGGMTKGYQRAGFYVVGMDIEPQPNYCGDEFVQGDAMTVLRVMAYEAQGPIRWHAIHASPPCQHYSDLAHRNRNADEWPDLVPEVQGLLRLIGLPYVIENVEGAPLRDPVRLCGTMFPGLRVLRHRLFEAGGFHIPEPAHPKHPLVFTHDKRKAHYGKLDQNTSFVQVTGGGNCTIDNARDAMGIDWMTKAELNEAIPPAYAEYVGRYLHAAIERRAAA